MPNDKHVEVEQAKRDLAAIQQMGKVYKERLLYVEAVARVRGWITDDSSGPTVDRTS